MNWNIAVGALAAITVVSLLSGFLFGQRRKTEASKGILTDYLLANEGLGKLSVVDLLFSTSFSLAGMLYQAYLGYTIGAFALIVQGAWAASFFLLAPHMDRIRGADSLHAFLGNNFGAATRRLAGFCSIAGFMILIGWEFNVAHSTFGGLIKVQDPNQQSTLLFIFVSATLFASFLYTVIGGLRSNAMANRVQNSIKLLVFGGLIFLLWPRFEGSLLYAAFPYDKVIPTLGIFGLITNIAFSLAWQFVDMSAWHSVIASRQKLTTEEAKNSLRWSGLAVFLAPGIVGTALGIVLSSTAGLDGNNVMEKVVEVIPNYSILLFVVFMALLASVMSTVDGLLLSSAYSGVCDVLYQSQSLGQIDQDQPRAAKLLSRIRLFLGLVAIAGALVVFGLVQGWGISLFDVVYFLIIFQLSLMGPIAIGLFHSTRTKANRMSMAIVAALAVGLGCFLVNKYVVPEWGWLNTGAGCFTMFTSYVCALILSSTDPRTEEALS